MIRHRRLRLLRAGGVLASGAALVLACCGSATPAGAASVAGKAKASSPSGSITYFWWGDPVRNQVTDAVIKLFQKAYPSVSISGEELAWTNYWEKVTVEAAAKTLPCVTQTQSRELTTYTGSNVFMPLNSLIKKGLINVSGIPKSILDTGAVNGNIYMIPYGAAYDVLLYNKTLVAKAGLKPPTQGWSYAQFGKWLAALQAKLPKGDYAIDQNGTNSDAFLIYAMTNGYSLFNKSGQLGFPASLLKSFWSIYLNWQKQGIAVPEAMAAQEPTTSEESYLVKGKVAVEGEPANQFDDVVTTAATTHAGSMGLMLYPYGSKGLGEAIITSGLSIPANCNDVDAAAAFINFFTNNSAASKAYASNNGANTVTKLLNAQVASPSTPGPVKQYLQTYNYIATHNVPAVQYPPGYTAVFTDLFPQVFQKILTNEESLSAGVASFIQQAKVDLAK